MEIPTSRRRALSRKEYLDALPSPSQEDIRRILAVQLEKERLVDSKYHLTNHTTEQHQAAIQIQRTYRGHRERRQMEGLTLDPSARWTEAIREMRYRAATQPINLEPGRPRASSGLANWQRATKIAAHAGAGESITPLLSESVKSGSPASPIPPPSPDTMTMDMRYFLEMVDPKHRYGANLQIYHQEWLRSQSNQNFFYWLDHGQGRTTSLLLCDRGKLDRECIRYLNREERKDYLVQVDDDGKLRWDRNGQLITTSADLYKDTMHGIVPKDAEGVIFADDSVKQELSQQRRFARKLAKLSVPKLPTVDPPFASASSSSGSDSDSPPPSPTALEASLAHTTLAPDHPSGSSPHHHHFHVSPATILNSLLRASIRPGTWIYVADTVGRLYVGIKSSGAFQHASFLSGARISSAGSIAIADGTLTYLSPLSGHYRPTTRSFRGFLDALRAQGVDLRRLRVSSAYRVLLGMEVYGRTKRGFHKGSRHDPGEDKERDGGADERAPLDENGGGTARHESLRRHVHRRDEALTAPLTAVDLVQRHWEEEHGR